MEEHGKKTGEGEGGHRACVTCMHFARYYVKEGENFAPVYDGRCCLRLLTSSRDTEFPYEEGCVCWEEREQFDFRV